MKPCKWCGARNPALDCDCAERRGCSRAGEVGHRMCGKCEQCDKPKFMCMEHQMKSVKPS